MFDATSRWRYNLIFTLDKRLRLLYLDMTSLDSSFIMVDNEKVLPDLSLSEIHQTMTENKSEESVGDSTTLCSAPWS